MRRIADDARYGEGQAVTLRHACCDMRFHVDRKRAGRAMQIGLLG
jgi:hypothetical protein